MEGAEKRLATAQLITVADVRQLWEDGHHGPAIRAALEGWEHLRQPSSDLDWLARALRTSGLGAEALAVQLVSTRQEARLPAWEGLIRSILQSGDPWWARDLL